MTLALTHAPACALFLLLRLGHYLESDTPIWTWEHRLQPELFRLVFVPPWVLLQCLIAPGDFSGPGATYVDFPMGFVALFVLFRVRRRVWRARGLGLVTRGTWFRLWLGATFGWLLWAFLAAMVWAGVLGSPEVF